MAEFNGDDIIGKTLVANIKVPVNRTAIDSSPVVFTVQPGQVVGVVTAWLKQKPGRSTLYWEFKDENNRSYYAAHVPGRYSIRSLTNQGVKTTEQKVEEEKRESESLKDTLERNFKKILLYGGGAYVAGKLISGWFNSRKK